MDHIGRFLHKERLMNIVVVDDEKIILNSVVRVLSGAGHNVFPIASGEGAVEKIKELHPDYLFLDVKIPGLSGMDILRDIKRSGIRTKVVMMSGYTSPDNVEEAKKLGADIFLKKPFDNIFDILKIVV